MRHTLTLALSALTLLLAACDPSSERECGTFDHPDLALWQSNRNAGNVQLMSSDGSTIDFMRSAIALNAPFEGVDTTDSSSDVTCQLTARVEYTASNEALKITTYYVQLEREDVPSDVESLVVESRIQAPVGTPRIGGYHAPLGSLTDRDSSRDNDVDYRGRQVLGGVSYDDVIVISSVSLGNDSNGRSDAASVVRQLAFARTFGLIGLTDGNGKDFVRVAN